MSQVTARQVRCPRMHQQMVEQGGVHSILEPLAPNGLPVSEPQPATATHWHCPLKATFQVCVRFLHPKRVPTLLALQEVLTGLIFLPKWLT